MALVGANGAGKSTLLRAIAGAHRLAQGRISFDGGAYLAIVLTALAVGVVALPTSLLAFRLSGGQFAIGMWVIAECFRLLVVNTPALGGGSGRSLAVLSSLDPAVRQAQVYWLALALTAVFLAAVFVLLRSRLGVMLEAIRDDAHGAASVGVRVTAAKRLVFVLAAAGCAAAGGLTLARTWYLIGLGTLAVVMALRLPHGAWGTLARRFDLELLPVGYRLRGKR